MSDPTEFARAAQQNPAASVATSADETTPRINTGEPKFGPPAPGEVGTLGPYRVVKELGKGGMGAVYLAVDTRLDRKLALKVMLPEFIADRDAKERFLREARAAAKVSHDNVVTVFEADERAGVPYIAMQFLQGYPLDEYLKHKGAPPLPHVIRIAREAALGLAAAHALGLVHRDVKPANLWLEAPNGRVKVLDFGLAKPVGADVELTKSGAVVGTPAYMSPEQARGQKVDHRTDLFSLGAVLYRLCTGRAPFVGPNVMAVLMALGTEESTPVRELNPAVPEGLAQLIHQLLAKNPEHRPQTAAEVAKRLRAILDRVLSPAPAVATPGTGELSLSRPVVVHPVPVQPPVVLPLQITVPPENAFADLDVEDDEATEVEPVRRTERTAGVGRVWAVVALVGVLAAAAVAGVIIKITRPDGTQTTLEVPDGSKVTIDPSGNPTVQLPKAAPKAAPVGGPADRAAAEWVLGAGGMVVVSDAGTEREVRAVKDLPAGPFLVVAIDLGGAAGVDAQLEKWKALPGLRSIDLPHSGVTDAGLKHIGEMVGLTNLGLHYTRVSDTGVGHLKGLKALSGLALNGTDVTDAGLKHLIELPALRALFLDNVAGVTDDGLEHLGKMSRLGILGLYGTKVTDTGVAKLTGMEYLGELHLHQTKVTAAGAEVLAKARPRCRVLSDRWTIEPAAGDRAAAAWALFVGGKVAIRGADGDREVAAAKDLPAGAFALTAVSLQPLGDKVTDDALARLKTVTDLRSLNLGGTKVTGPGMAQLAPLKALTNLNLAGTAVGDDGLAWMEVLPKLDTLGLQDTPVTDAGLMHLAGLNGLVLLDLRSSKVTTAGVEKLRKALPKCKIEWDEPKK